jgi:hypothetical protein
MGMSGAIGATSETTLPVGQPIEPTTVPNIPALTFGKTTTMECGPWLKSRAAPTPATPRCSPPYFDCKTNRNAITALLISPPLNYRPITYKFQKVLMVACADCHRPLRKNRIMR